MRISIALLILSISTSFSQSKKFPPFTNYERDTSVIKFISDLKVVISQKDGKRLLSIVDSDVKISFGGSHGLNDFKEIWKPQNQNSEIWPLLNKLVTLGGVFMKNSGSTVRFVLPYVNEVEGGDHYKVLVVTGKNINVRERPNLNSKILGQLTYDVVDMDYSKSVLTKNVSLPEYADSKDWFFVETLDKKLRGFVYWEFLWSPIGYRMFLDKINGTWKITGLIAGD
jgi:hypothetical protein